jgi:peptide/nickel transport system substrate-binding protein
VKWEMHRDGREDVNVDLTDKGLFNRRRFLQGLGGVFLLHLCGESDGCAGQQPQVATGGSPKKGGILKVAINADPPTLDWTSSTATATRNIAWHIFEQPFAFDHDYRVRPMLADTYQVSDDRKTYTIKLRRGIKFHDGSPMKAEDVIASEVGERRAPSG